MISPPHTAWSIQLPFGEFLVKKAYVSASDVLDALDYQRVHKKTLGAIMREEKLMKPEKILELLHDQRYRVNEFKLGELALKRKEITREQLDYALTIQDKQKMSLGHVLVQLERIDQASLDDALREYTLLRGASVKSVIL